LHCVHGDLAGATVNDRLMRLWFFTSAVRDAGASSITVVAPYLPYSRKDRRTQLQDPLGSRYIAEHFEASGATRIVALEPHNVSAFENAFRIETAALPFAPLLVDWIAAQKRVSSLVVVSPDFGGAKRAQLLQEQLERRSGILAGLAVVAKRRHESTVTGGALAGKVSDATCLIVDDLVSSGATLALAAQACRAAGAREMWVAAAHALFLPQAAANMRAAGFARVLVSDSVPISPGSLDGFPVEVLGLGSYLGNALRNLWAGESLADLIGQEQR
jgi:ribose-phosphate pyrophosphokinase